MIVYYSVNDLNQRLWLIRIYRYSYEYHDNDIAFWVFLQPLITQTILMSKNKSEYFLEELKSWLNTIELHKKQKVLLDRSLEDIVRRNSLIDIAAKVEAHQILLNEVAIKLKALEERIHHQELTLKPENILIEDALLTTEMEQIQTELRQHTLTAEKEFIDIKYYCHDFLSDTLKK